MFQPIAGERQCHKCGQCKPLTEFNRYTNGTFRPCYACCREYSRARYRKKHGVPGKWKPTEAEVAAIARHYPTGGPSGCLPYLREGITPLQVRRVARNHGIRCIPGATHPANKEPEQPWALPAHDLSEQLACLRLRNWRGPVMAGPLVGVIA